MKATSDLILELESIPLFQRRGRVVQALGTTVHATGLSVSIGQTCEIVDPARGFRIMAEVIGLTGQTAILTPLSPLDGVSLDAEVIPCAANAEISIGPGLLGRVVDAHGAPLDDLGPVMGEVGTRPIRNQAPNPLKRRPVDQVMPTGVKVIDTLLTVGLGQRMGVFSTAGGGKSTLLGMLARAGDADVNIVALIGERGREVREFLDRTLCSEGLKRSIVIVSTADRPAMERIRAAHVATAMAEYFRSQGLRVMLLVDSITRFARALREIGLAAGEPPVRRGYPPSVFAELPRLFERAGSDNHGSITAFYTILLEDEESDPIGEEVRALLDGHIVLSRTIAERGRYPAVDVNASLSRTFLDLTDEAHRHAAVRVRSWIAKYAEIDFLLQVGEYKPGGDAVADEAIQRIAQIEALLSQSKDQAVDFDLALDDLLRVAS